MSPCAVSHVEVGLFNFPTVYISPDPARREVNPAPTHLRMDPQQAALAICGVTAAYILYKRYRAFAISDIPGPKNPSWVYGISSAFRTNRWHLLTGPEQGTRGGGSLRSSTSSRRVFWKNTAPYLAGTGCLGCASKLFWIRHSALLADAITQEERLWVADPKAIHHILQGSNRLYEKPHAVTEQLTALFDCGIVAVEGELPSLLRDLLTDFELRRCTPTAEESHESGLRTC
jgi:hypothetical protein